MVVASVEGAVENILKGAPAPETGTEKPSGDAPAKDTPDKGGESEVSKGDQADLTAFEQELVQDLEPEVKAEFEASTPAEQKRFLTWAKRHYRSNAKAMTELGLHRKVMGALREAGLTSEELVKLAQERRNGKSSQSATPAEKKRAYDRWREKAQTPEEREALSDAEQVQRELIEDVVRGILEKEVKPLRDRLEWSDRQILTKRAQTLEQEINTLEDDLGYPGSLVETHREAMRQLGLREPDLSPEDLLVRVAGFQTVKAAMTKRSQKEEEASPKPGASPVVKKPASTALTKDRRGWVSVSEAARSLLRPSK